jgi:hypothetical protein
MKFSYNDAIALQTRRVFNVIAKRFLVLLEDLQNDHHINFQKLKESLPEFEFLIRQADYFDDPKFSHYRKRILDVINDGYRELDEEIKKYDLAMRKESYGQENTNHETRGTDRE